MPGHILPVCTRQPAVPFDQQWPRVPSKQIMDRAIAIQASLNNRNITLPQDRSNFYNSTQYVVPAQDALPNYFAPQESQLVEMQAKIMA